MIVIGVHLALPEIPVSVGETWSVDLTYPLTLFSGLGRDEGVPISGGLYAKMAQSGRSGECSENAV